MKLQLEPPGIGFGEALQHASCHLVLGVWCYEDLVRQPAAPVPHLRLHRQGPHHREPHPRVVVGILTGQGDRHGQQHVRPPRELRELAAALGAVFRRDPGHDGSAYHQPEEGRVLGDAGEEEAPHRGEPADEEVQVSEHLLRVQDLLQPRPDPREIVSSVESCQLRLTHEITVKQGTDPGMVIGSAVVQAHALVRHVHVNPQGAPQLNHARCRPAMRAQCHRVHRPVSRARRGPADGLPQGDERGARRCCRWEFIRPELWSVPVVEISKQPGGGAWPASIRQIIKLVEKQGRQGSQQILRCFIPVHIPQLGGHVAIGVHHSEDAGPEIAELLVLRYPFQHRSRSRRVQTVRSVGLVP
mmetsp:Transcript_21611/g.55315  ORF Transcript_21611/g.55315 Transcript_21611/m.55315 type:complete len:357 (-) Transcript_21611:1093-2163(-)